MTLSLKEKNSSTLAFLLVANVTAYFAALGGGIVSEDLWSAFAEIKIFSPALVVVVLAGVLNSQIDPTNKARLVFWRWTNPLPGCRAFSQHMHQDSRIDVASIRRIKRVLPTSPTEQNALWFKWYRDLRDDPAIVHVHRHYLLYRDYTGLLVLMMLSLVPLGFWQMGTRAAAGYTIFLIAQFILVCRAARNHGIRFVTTVLAGKATQG